MRNIVTKRLQVFWLTCWEAKLQSENFLVNLVSKQVSLIIWFECESIYQSSFLGGGNKILCWLTYTEKEFIGSSWVAHRNDGQTEEPGSENSGNQERLWMENRTGHALFCLVYHCCPNAKQVMLLLRMDSQCWYYCRSFENVRTTMYSFSTVPASLFLPFKIQRPR